MRACSARPEAQPRYEDADRGRDGRRLALLAGAPRDEHGDLLLVTVDPSMVAPNPEQPRKDFDEEGLQVLAASLRRNGLLHPIVVQRDGDGYRLVAGERRLRAAQMAGLTTIPAMVRPEAESGRLALELALTENLIRTDLNPMEQAAAYARLSDTFGLGHKEIGERVGKSRPAISNAIRLLGLAAPVQRAVAEWRVPATVARLLLALPEAEQEGMAVEIERSGMGQTAVEREVQRRLEQLGTPPARSTVLQTPKTRTSADDDALQRALEQTIGLPVRLERLRRGGGRLVIEWLEEDDLDALYNRLGGPPL